MSTEEPPGASDSVMDSQGAATTSDASGSAPGRPLLAAVPNPVEVSDEPLLFDDFYRNERRQVLGLAFVLTGSLSRPRTEFAERITRAGGIVQSAVSKNTKYLIAGANVGATKTDKARALGTQVIDEATLESMLAASGIAAATAPAANPPPAQPTLF